MTDTVIVPTKRIDGLKAPETNRHGRGDGTGDGRRVTLQWNSQFGAQLEHRVLNGVISIDAETITVTESLNGGPRTSAPPLRRIR